MLGMIFLIHNQRIKIESLEHTLHTQKVNVRGLMEENSSIKLSYKELNEYVSTSENKFARDIDSITRENDIKLKNLQKLTQVKTIIEIRDTVEVEAKSIIANKDSTYNLSFSKENNCINAEIIAITKDPNTKVIFDRIEANSEGYTIVYKENKKWWQLFKKRKIFYKTVNNCGETVIKEVEVYDK